MIDKYNEVEIEADGFITRAETLERINANKAKPASECIYPCCEDCDKYHGHWCTVPMVISKQIWRMTAGRIFYLEKRLADLERLVTDEMLGLTEQTKSDPNAELNYTLLDYIDDTMGDE